MPPQAQRSLPAPEILGRLSELKTPAVDRSGVEQLTPIASPFEDLEATVRELRRAYREKPSPYRLPLASNTFGDAEIAAALEALLRGQVTMGPRVRAFEEAFAAEHDAPAAVFCNSGSSANLLALALLTYPDGVTGREPVLRPGDEVIVPAVTCSTTVWPVVQMGAVPVLADVSPATLNLTVESVERALSPRTRAVFAVHLLGNPAPVSELAELCNAKGLTLIEDACEALDTEVGDDGRKAGTFGRLGTFSFYFSHHISTIEGGMVLTRSEDDADRLRALRSHGLTRHISPARRRQAEEESGSVDPRFLFVESGFNLRGTDVQAAIGLVQLGRRAGFLERRHVAARVWTEARDRWPDVFLPLRIARGSSQFAFPIVLHPDSPGTTVRLRAHLEEAGVETRPLLAGNLADQPAMKRLPHRVAGPLSGAEILHERSIYVGLNPGMTDEQIGMLPPLIDSFAREVRRGPWVDPPCEHVQHHALAAPVPGPPYGGRAVQAPLRRYAGGRLPR